MKQAGTGPDSTLVSVFGGCIEEKKPLSALIELYNPYLWHTVLHVNIQAVNGRLVRTLDCGNRCKTSLKKFGSSVFTILLFGR